MAELATIARPYSEALFQVARKGDIQAWAQQIEALAGVTRDPAIRQFADNPKVQPQDVFDVITTAVKRPLEGGIANFLRAVIENGRLAALPEVATQFHALVNGNSGVSDALIHSAFPIDAPQLAELVATLEKRFGRKLSAQVVVEPELIGGVRVVVGDEVLDTSVKARLEHMKVALTA
jgi:F-type H+-transporting ATPase subunit delta